MGRPASGAGRGRARPAPPPGCPPSRQAPQDVLEPADLLELGHRREEDHLLAAEVGVAAEERRHVLRRREQPGCDLLGERPGERVIVAHVGQAPLPGVVTEGEVPLAPQHRLTGPAGVAPGRADALDDPGEAAGRPAAVYVAVGVQSHAGDCGIAGAAGQDRGRVDLGAVGLVPPVPELADHRGQPLTPAGGGDPGRLVVVGPGADTEPEDQPAARHRLDGGGLLGQQGRVPERPDHHHRQQPDPLGHRRRSGQGRQRLVSIGTKAVDHTEAGERALFGPAGPPDPKRAVGPRHRVRQADPHPHAPRVRPAGVPTPGARYAFGMRTASGTGVDPAALGFRPRDLVFIADPYPAYAELRAAGRIIHNPETEQWIIPHYEDVNGLLRDRRFGRTYLHLATHREMGRPEDPLFTAAFWHLIRNGILDMEPPDHTRVRRLVAKAFTPRRVQELRPTVQRLMDGLIEEVLGAGEVDLISTVAESLPVTVIAELLGIPEADRHHLRPWSAEICRMYELNPTEEDGRAASAAAVEFSDYLRELIERGVLEDGKIRGVRVTPGEERALLFGSATRAPAAVDRPDELDLGREPNPHMTFGAGIHFCLGAPLGRVELETSFGTLLRRAPHMELAAEPEWKPNYIIRGLRELRVRL